MVYNYLFKDEITLETVNDLIEKIQDKEKINLWFSTNGGDCEDMAYLISVFNSLGKKITITLTGEVCSAGTDLLIDYTGKLKISKNIDYMLFHKADRYILMLRKSGISSKKLLKILEEDNKKYLKKLVNKGILNKKQLIQFNNGKDVILYKKDILKLKL